MQRLIIEPLFSTRSFLCATRSCFRPPVPPLLHTNTQSLQHTRAANGSLLPGLGRALMCCCACVLQSLPCPPQLYPVIPNVLQTYVFCPGTLRPAPAGWLQYEKNMYYKLKTGRTPWDITVHVQLMQSNVMSRDEACCLKQVPEIQGQLFNSIRFHKFHFKVWAALALIGLCTSVLVLRLQLRLHAQHPLYWAGTSLIRQDGTRLLHLEPT
jgi:hypothetical protein